MVLGSYHGLVHTAVVSSLVVNIWVVPDVEGELSCPVARVSQM